MGHRGQEHRSTHDNANDLLAAILHDTEAEARQEREQLEYSLRKRKLAEEHRQKEELELRRQRAKDQISVEMQRLKGLEQRRDERQQRTNSDIERLHGLEKLKAMREEARRKHERAREDDGEQTEDRPMRQRQSTSPARPAAIRAKQLEQPADTGLVAQAHADVTQEMADKSGPNNWPKLVALAVVALFVGGAGVAGFSLTVDGYEQDNSTYAKTVYKPIEPRDMQVFVGYTPIRTESERAQDRRATQRKQITTRVAAPAPAAASKPAPATEKEKPAPKKEPKDPTPALMPDLDDPNFDPFADTP